MSNGKVYLAGPIGGLDYEGATDWRVDAAKTLSAVGITSYDPMRWKSFLDNEEKISVVANTYTHPLATSRGIMARDYNDCKTCDVILVNLLPCAETGKPTLGTVMEMAWAYAFQKPLVVIAKDDDEHVLHPMISEAISYHVPTIEQGLKIVKAILCPKERRVG